jgi:hypothetical protein
MAQKQLTRVCLTLETRWFVIGEAQAMTTSIYASLLAVLYVFLSVRTIRLRTLRPLEPDEEDLERSGWCRIGEPFELDLGYEDVFYNEYINIGFRTDRWVVPGPLLRAKLREAETVYLAKKGRERLGRKEKAELKTLVAQRLRKSLSPAMRNVDLSWSVQEGVVRFFSFASAA